MCWGLGGRRLGIACVAAWLLLLLLLLLLPSAASAATTIHVRTTADLSSGPGDTGDCLAADQTCSLRQALAAAQNGDTVSLPAGIYQLVQNLPLEISTNITLSGAGPRTTVIRQMVSNRIVLFTGSGTVVTIQGVKITGGHGTNGAYGGGILSTGTLTLRNSAVTGNESDGYEFVLNMMVSYQPGLGGGILENGGPLTIIRSVISGNSAQPGPGLGAAGGGIWSGNPVTVVNSTIAGNTAQGAGGGGGDTSGFGGGIYMAVNGPDQLTLANATVAFNTASGSPGSQGGNIYLVGSGAQTAVKNSIIADGSADSGSENCFGALHSLGYNLEDRQQCGLSAATDLHPANAALGQLTNNGGPTDTVGLLSGSPAINAGNPSGCTDPLSVTIATDQRRIARPQGARCDIGAFEFRTVTLVGSPQVSGTPRVGNRLRCLLPAVQSPDGPANKTISWLRDGAPVGAGMTYVVRAADAQHFLRCRVLASNSAGSTSARSAAVLVPPPPTVTITSSSVSAAHHKATFKFTTQHATRAKCALARGSATPQYSPCTSPRTYRRLAAGSYAFFVRAVGPGGTSAPARHSFKIR